MRNYRKALLLLFLILNKYSQHVVRISHVLPSCPFSRKFGHRNCRSKHRGPSSRGYRMLQAIEINMLKTRSKLLLYLIEHTFLKFFPHILHVVLSGFSTRLSKSCCSAAVLNISQLSLFPPSDSLLEQEIMANKDSSIEVIVML